MNTLVLLCLSLVWTGYAHSDKFCNTTTCLFEETADLSKSDAECDRKTIELRHMEMVVKAWVPDLGVYEKRGTVDAYGYNQKDFKYQMHGAKVFPGSRPSDGFLKRDFYMADSGVERILAVQNIPEFKHTGNHTADGPSEAQLSTVATVLAPSTMEFLTNEDGEYTGMLVAEGNPFVIDQRLNKKSEIGWGQLEYVPAGASDPQKCKSLYPTKFDQPDYEFGKCLNTVECIPELNMCFMTAWRFWDSSNRWKHLGPDCLVWCKVDDITNPGNCVAHGTVQYANGTNVCAANGNGGTHAVMVLNKNEIVPTKKNGQVVSASVDLLGLFCGGPFFDKGDSHIQKISLDIAFGHGPMSVFVRTTADMPFATDLWAKTVTKPHDTGLDHAWQDGKGYIFVSSFRRMNNGIHVLSKTGELLFTISGFDLAMPNQYTYPSGVSGFGSFLEEDSFIVVTASDINTPIIGKASFFVVDISQLHSFYPSRT